jgi:hypothetical protein
LVGFGVIPPGERAGERFLAGSAQHRFRQQPGPDPPASPADPLPASVATRRQAAYTHFTMLDETVTLRLPEELHHRLAAVAAATRRSLEEILLHALRIGSPPAWDDAPPEHQVVLAAMDRLDDDALWKLARGRRSEAEMVRYDELLEQSAARALGDAERSELEMLRREADRFMLIKAHAAILLRWRGHDVPVR